MWIIRSWWFRMKKKEMMHTTHYSTKLLSLDDISVAAKLYLNVFSTPPWKERWDHNLACQRLEHIANCQGFYGISIWIEKKLIGFCMGNIEPFNKTSYFYLKEVCVSNKYHNQGIGSIMLDRLVKDLQKAQVDSAYLITQRQDQLEHFYKKNGFKLDTNLLLFSKTLTSSPT